MTWLLYPLKIMVVGKKLVYLTYYYAAIYLDDELVYFYDVFINIILASA